MFLTVFFLRWYSLKCKPGQKKDDYRGELEVRTAFTVKSTTGGGADGGSTADLPSGGSKKEKHKGSLQSLNKKVSGLGGSLMSLGTKEKKNLKKLAKTVSGKVEKVGDKAKKSLSRSNLSKSKDKDLVSLESRVRPNGVYRAIPFLRESDFPFFSLFGSSYPSRHSLAVRR